LIKLENDLAEELLKTSKSERSSKYSEVYEKLYSFETDGKREELSKNYLNAAIYLNNYLRKVIGHGKYILDLGCGFGHLSALLAKDGNFVTGIDINRLHINESKETYGNINNLKFYKTNGVLLNFPDNSFDFVVSTSVFEHIHPDDINMSLSEIRRVLKNGGIYIFTAITPYIRGDISAFSKDPEQRKKTGLHINCRTWAELNQLLVSNGFEGKTDILPEKITNHINFLVPLSYKIFLEKKFRINKLFVIFCKMGWVKIVAKVKKE
jgi:ubiquinone/menaquinone biosynthesis C-methylase UbiE